MSRYKVLLICLGLVWWHMKPPTNTEGLDRRALHGIMRHWRISVTCVSQHWIVSRPLSRGKASVFWKENTTKNDHTCSKKWLDGDNLCSSLLRPENIIFDSLKHLTPFALVSPLKGAICTKCTVLNHKMTLSSHTEGTYFSQNTGWQHTTASLFTVRNFNSRWKRYEGDCLPQCATPWNEAVLVSEPTQLKNKKLTYQSCAKIRVNGGAALERWRQLRAWKDFTTDATWKNNTEIANVD